MPIMQSTHSFNLKGRITASASSIHIIKVREGKNRKEAMPSEKPILNMAPFALG